MASLILSKISKKFNEQFVVKDFDLSIDKGEIVVLVGPSGCGKSTLLRIIAGLEEPDVGSVELYGNDITWVEPHNRSVAMVFQNYALYPHMTVSENLAYPLKIAKIGKSQRTEKIKEIAGMLQIENLLPRYPATLSGGQRQRVAIGRSLVRQPEIFLFDEPLSNLDARLRETLRLEIAALHQKIGKTMIYVTHDQHEAMTLGEKLAVLNQGKIEQCGSPIELYNNPRTLFVAKFLGSPQINIFEVDLQDREKSPFADFEFGLPESQPSKFYLAIRPENICLEAKSENMARNSLNLKITQIENLGHLVYTYLAYQNLSFIAVSEKVVGERNSEIKAYFPPEKFLLFNRDETRIN